MKRAFIILATGLLLAGTARAQDYRHEAYGGFGLWSTNTILDVFTDIIVTGATAGGYTSENDSYVGDFFVGYRYLVSPRIAVGGAFAYANSRSDALFNQQRTGKLTSNYYTLAAEIDYRYICRRGFTLYSGVGLGATLYHQKYLPETGESSTDDTVGFNFQVTPIGIRYGQRIGVFAEVGFGYKGIVSLGAFGRF